LGETALLLPLSDDARGEDVGQFAEVMVGWVFRRAVDRAHGRSSGNAHNALRGAAGMMSGGTRVSLSVNYAVRDRVDDCLPDLAWER
jgi:hypothetical protein